MRQYANVLWCAYNELLNEYAERWYFVSRVSPSRAFVEMERSVSRSFISCLRKITNENYCFLLSTRSPAVRVIFWRRVILTNGKWLLSSQAKAVKVSSASRHSRLSERSRRFVCIFDCFSFEFLVLNRSTFLFFLFLVLLILLIFYLDIALSTKLANQLLSAS